MDSMVQAILNDAAVLSGQRLFDRLADGSCKAFGAERVVIARVWTTGVVVLSRAGAGEPDADLDLVLSPSGDDTIVHVPLKDPEKRAVGVVAARFPVSGDAVRQAEALLSRLAPRLGVEISRDDAHERYDLLVPGIADAVWDWDIRSSSWSIDLRTETLLGYSREELSAMPRGIRGLIHAEDRDSQEAALEAYLAGGDQRYDARYRVIAKNGDVRWVSCRGSVRRDAYDAPRRMVGTLLDVTEQVQLERQLRERQEQLSACMDAGHVHVWDFDALTGRNLVAASPGGIQNLDQIQEAQTWQDWVDVIHPEDRRTVIETVNAQLKAAKGDHRMEYRVRTADGTWRWVLSVGRVFEVTKDGRSARVLGAIMDISERKEMEQRLKESLAETENAWHKADQANRLKSEFIANMSHEIRTPLNGVMGMAQLLRMSDLPESAGEKVDTILTSGEALLSLINDILDLSRIEAGLLDFECDPFEVADLLRQVTDTVRGLAVQKNLDLRIEVEGGGIVLGDVDRLRQVLTNLAGNAVKFTESGEVVLRCLPGAPGWFRFEVADTGPGIPQDQIGIIFDRFRQADHGGSGRHRGSGLGLAISREIVDLAGGRIGVESTVGKGTVFRVDVPLPLVGAAPEHARGPALARRPSGVGPQRILLAEDNAVNRDLFIEMISGMGHEVIVACNGREALTCLDQDRFDLIVLDQEMPVMTGEQVLRHLRASGTPHADIPVIVLTAHAMKGARERLLAAGADAFLTKPVKVETLAETIGTVTDRARRPALATVS